MPGVVFFGWYQHKGVRHIIAALRSLKSRKGDNPKPMEEEEPRPLVRVVRADEGTKIPSPSSQAVLRHRGKLGDAFAEDF